MIRRRSIWKKALHVAVILGLTCATSVMASDTKITIADANKVGSMTNQMNAYFTKIMGEMKDSGLSVMHIKGVQLGNAPQVMDQLVSGSVDIFGNDMAWVAPYDQDLAVLTWGFAFRDADHLQKFFDSDLFDEINERIRTKHGIRVLYAVPGQPRLIFSTKEINTIDDVQGLKIRVPQIRAWLDLWTAFGSSPTPMAFGEVYMGLKTNLIQAGGGPPSAAYPNKYHEVAKYIIDLGHLTSTMMLVINEEKYQSLTEEQQQLVTEKGIEAVKQGRIIAEKENSEVVAKMVAEGAMFSELKDKEPFMAKAAEAGAQMEEDGVWSKGLLNRIQEIK